MQDNSPMSVYKQFNLHQKHLVLTFWERMNSKPLLSLLYNVLLSFVGVGQGFKVDDLVMLRGLTNAKCNGCAGMIIKLDQDAVCQPITDQRCPVLVNVAKELTPHFVQMKQNQFGLKH